MAKKCIKKTDALFKFRCTYSTCGPFTKNKEMKQKIKETGGTTFIYQNHK